MKNRTYTIFLTVIAFLFLWHMAVAYDFNEIVHSEYRISIHNNMFLLKTKLEAIKKSAEHKDYYSTADNFMEIARLLKELENSKWEDINVNWIKIHNRIINAAFKGIGACGEKNDEAINHAIEDITTYMEKGHSIFKK